MEELRTQFYVYNGGGYTPADNSKQNKKDDSSIFTEAGSQELKNKLEDVQSKQGFIGKLWNGFKNLTGLGLSSNDAEKAIKDYKNGDLSYEEAEYIIEKYEKKQSSVVDIAANVAAGVAVAAITVGTCGAGLAAGAAAGGAVKAGLKTLDRATNEVEGDALDAKQIAKDGITGAVSGAVTVATAGMGAGASVAGQGLKAAVKQGIIQGAKRGAISGAAAGATSYTTDAIFEEDVHFNIRDLMTRTAENALAGGITGGVMGGTSGAAKEIRISELVGLSEGGRLSEQDKEFLELLKGARADAKRGVYKNKIKDILENGVFA